MPDGSIQSILCQDGKIVEISPGLFTHVNSFNVIECSNKLEVFPGCIDPHVHFRSPGAQEKEDFISGSKAAVKGGVTTVFDMPNTNPRTIFLSDLEEKKRLSADAVCNVYFNFGADANNFDSVKYAARDLQVKALKIYMGNSTGEGGLPPEYLDAHFDKCSRLGMPIILHCEDNDTIAGCSHVYEHIPQNHNKLRPLAAEMQSVGIALGIATKYPELKLYFAHSTTAGVQKAIDDANLSEQCVVEVCPHHLIFSEDDVENNYLKVNPPIRSFQESGSLLEMFCEGNMIAGSDHAPHTKVEKDKQYSEAPSGIPGVEYLFPLLYDFYRRGLYNKQTLVNLTSRNAAMFFGLNKGRIEEGLDADFVIMNPSRGIIVNDGLTDKTISRCGYSPYQGTVLKGSVEHTIVGGKLAYSYKD